MSLPSRVHPGRGPHLLLVHGFLSSPAQWQPNLAALSSQCVPVTVSLWGHAGAPSPDDPAAYDPAAYVAAFEALREQLGIERWFVLGYSLGAGLTLQYALTHPQRVLGHAFTNSTSALADAALQQRWTEEAAVAGVRIETDGHAAMERSPVHPRHARTLPGEVRAALCADAQRHDPRGIANTLRYTNPRASVRHRLAENTRPALLLCGTRERRFQPLRTVAAERMPLLQIADLDAGHGMNMQAPDAFNAAVLSFLTLCCS